jgi:hypothetical protein
MLGGNVRFTPESGQTGVIAECAKSGHSHCKQSAALLDHLELKKNHDASGQDQTDGTGD